MFSISTLTYKLATNCKCFEALCTVANPPRKKTESVNNASTIQSISGCYKSKRKFWMGHHLMKRFRMDSWKVYVVS